MGRGILPEQVPHQAVDQSRDAILHSGDRSSSHSKAQCRPEREVVQPGEVGSGAGLTFHELECCAEVGIARQHVALLAGWRGEPVAPERNSVNDWRQFWAGREVHPDPRSKNDELESEGASFGFNHRDVSLVADRAPSTIAMPGEIFELATAPKAILRRRQGKLLQYVAHEAPALHVGQLCKVTKHAGEVCPEQRIDPRDFSAAETEVDACGAGFECRGGIVEGGRADAEHANALSGKSAEVYLVGRMGIALRGEARGQGVLGPPAAAAVDASCKHDLSCMYAFGAASPTQMGKQKVAGRFDRRDLDFVFDRKLENVAVPIQVVSPYLRGNILDALPCLATEFRLVPSTRGKTRNAEVDARHLLGGSQLRHAGKPAPRPFEATRIAIHDPDICYALQS